jgi:hypothetical protein
MPPITCPACGLRQFCTGSIKSYETDWNRKGNGKHLSEAQAMNRVCQYNKKAGCLTQGLPQPLPEPVALGYLTPAERLALAEQLIAEFGEGSDAA